MLLRLTSEIRLFDGAVKQGGPQGFQWFLLPAAPCIQKSNNPGNRLFQLLGLDGL